MRPRKEREGPTEWEGLEARAFILSGFGNRPGGPSWESDCLALTREAEGRGLHERLELADGALDHITGSGTVGHITDDHLGVVEGADGGCVGLAGFLH